MNLSETWKEFVLGFVLGSIIGMFLGVYTLALLFLFGVAWYIANKRKNQKSEIFSR